MSARSMRLLVAAAVVLPLAAGLLVATSPGREEEGEEFQRLVRGLGLGAAVDLSRCAGAFDPRDGRACSLRHDAVPCGSIFCAAHAAAR